MLRQEQREYINLPSHCFRNGKSLSKGKLLRDAAKGFCALLIEPCETERSDRGKKRLFVLIAL